MDTKTIIDLIEKHANELEASRITEKELKEKALTELKIEKNNVAKLQEELRSLNKKWETVDKLFAQVNK